MKDALRTSNNVVDRPFRILVGAASSPRPVAPGRRSHKRILARSSIILGFLKYSIALIISMLAATVLAATQPGLLKSEFIFESAPFPQCHASTIAETKAGLVAAWFGGTRERNPDVGIWLSRMVGDNWPPPVEGANGVGF